MLFTSVTMEFAYLSQSLPGCFCDAASNGTNAGRDTDQSILTQTCNLPEHTRRSYSDPTPPVTERTFLRYRLGSERRLLLAAIVSLTVHSALKCEIFGAHLARGDRLLYSVCQQRQCTLRISSTSLGLFLTVLLPLATFIFNDLSNLPPPASSQSARD